MLEELQPGKVFHGRYEIVRCIKAGGMGAVYEAVHLETRRHRALKVMLPSIVRDEGMRSRFRMEAQITADVESDHIVETFDAGVDTETGAPFLVMELLRGEDLAHHLSARGRLPAGEVVGLMQQLARALEQTHASGIVHRDLKPENLFLAARGDDPPRLKILDFGIAKIVAQSSAQGGTTNLGTPLYMAPEQLEGASVSPRTDLFTVGHIAYTLLTGRAYWADEADAVGILPLIGRLARGPTEAASVRAARGGTTLPAAFNGWFAKATARNPNDRFERARDQIAALAAALDVAPHLATVPPPTALGGSASLGGHAARRGWAPDMETAPAPQSAESSPLAHSAAFAPTSRSADPSHTPAPAGTSLMSVGEPDVHTHHPSVRSIPESPKRSSWTRLLAIAAASLATIVFIAFGVMRRVAPTPEARVEERPPTPAAAPPPDAFPAGAASSLGTASPSAPVPRVDPAPPTPDTAPTPSSSGTASGPSPRVPRPPAELRPSAPATAAPKTTPMPKRDPSKVFQ